VSKVTKRALYNHRWVLSRDRKTGTEGADVT